MFRALREDGTSLQLLPSFSREVLKKEKESSHFYCPECKERVMMKLGTQRIAHFAHEAGSRCAENYERESMYHLTGKLQLYHWLETQGLQPRLEPYYERLKQRPDLSVIYAKKEYAIEYQCSTIPLELLMKRTNTYIKNNIDCFWLLGGSRIKRKAEKKVTLSKFDYLFLNKTSSGKWILPFYCSTSKKWILLNDITPISAKNALAQFIISPLQSFPLQQLFSFNQQSTITMEDWQNEIKAQKLGIVVHGHYYREFLHELYCSSINISLLPPFIGLPLTDSPLIETAPLFWQAYLFIDQLIGRKANDQITFSDVYRCFMHRVQKGQIKMRNLPFIKSNSPTFPLSEYLQLLVKVDVLEAVTLNFFRIKRDIKLPDHMIEAQKVENQFYQDFGHLLFQHK